MASSSASHSSPVRSAYFIHGGGVAPSNIDTSLFTHLYYAFAYMDPDSYSITTHPDDTSGYISTFSDTVRAANPAIKTLLSIGGGDESGSIAASFSDMAASPDGRAAFIESSISFAQSSGFDGLDLDWEYPSTPTDMSNLALLIQEWSSAAKAQSPPLLFTAAVHYNVTIGYDKVPPTYPAATMASYLDWVTLMAYDLHENDENLTGEHTALYDNTVEQRATANYGVQQWLSAQFPASSALLGLAAYGHSWFLEDPTVNGVGAPVSGYNSDLDFSVIQTAVSAWNGECAVDDTTVSAYCYWTPGPGQKTIWAGFDDPTTIAAKVEYLQQEGLRGYAFWSMDGDTNNVLFTQGNDPLYISQIYIAFLHPYIHTRISIFRIIMYANSCFSMSCLPKRTSLHNLFHENFTKTIQ